MVETLAVLKDTPIPTLLIIGGIALLVLSVAYNVGGKVKVARERQRWSGIAGLILVAVGAFLYIYKPEASAAPTPTSLPAPSLVPATVAPAATTPPQPTTAPTMLTCLNQPRYYQELWTGWVSRLGCPLSASSGGLKMSGQAFEHGWMFLRQDTRKIYILLPERRFMIFDDAWKAGDPEYSCPEIAVSQTPPTPKGSFGVVWCEDKSVQVALGLAVDAERSFNVTLQAFDNGLIFGDKKQTFILVETTQTWELVE